MTPTWRSRTSPSSARAAWRTLAGGVVLLLALDGSALSGTRATELVRQGIKLLNQAHYSDALGRFEAAYAADPSLSRTLLLAGVCQQNLGQLAAALTFYERFEGQDLKMSGEDRAYLRGYYDEVQAQISRQHPQGEELLLLDRARRGLARLSGMPLAEPAPVEVPSEAPAAAPETAPKPPAPQPSLALVPRASVAVAPRSPAAKKAPIYKRWWFWTAIGAGVAVVAGAAVLATPRATATPLSSNIYRPTF